MKRRQYQLLFPISEVAVSRISQNGQAANPQKEKKTTALGPSWNDGKIVMRVSMASRELMYATSERQVRFAHTEAIVFRSKCPYTIRVINK